MQPEVPFWMNECAWEAGHLTSAYTYLDDWAHIKTIRARYGPIFVPPLTPKMAQLIDYFDGHSGIPTGNTSPQNTKKNICCYLYSILKRFCGMRIPSVGPHNKLSLRYGDLSKTDLALSSNVSSLST
ncbi:unnamed protein product [Hymenolepis diminuta]|uniref:Uncharacterized protein n=1 Tax=Hymenolepis diminuta TaxID=6216 RepID=A0A564ZCG6_HYMDI|nr:unnamed protein product [Hymenolepis diminuta]